MNRKELRKSKRIVILCEGESEEIAVKQFIRRQWEKDNLNQVGLHPIDLNSHLEKIHFNAINFLKDEKVIAVFTLVDLYKFKGVETKTFNSLNKRIETAKNCLRTGLSEELLDRFHPHLSVYELEAWILAEGKALSNRLKSKAIHPEKKAEEKDDQNPPKNRLNKIFHKHGKPGGYKEIMDGIPLFRNLEFSIVYDSCPYFKKFYDDLKSIAQKALGEISVQ